MPSGTFAQRIADVALAEHRAFGGLHETSLRLRSRIYDTYLANLAEADPSDALGWNMPSDITTWAWSAVFVSWCVLKAGGTRQEFDFSIRHAVFIKKAIADADRGRGVFRGRRITAIAPKVGDLVCFNADGGTIAFEQARMRNDYSAHSAIVVGHEQQGSKRFAVTVGGNEQDAIRLAQVELTSGGFLRPRQIRPFICVIETFQAARSIRQPEEHR